MIAFWITCGIMIGLTLVIILPAFFRKSSPESFYRNQLNVKIAQQRMDELQREAELGSIAESDFAAAQNELEQSLLSDLDGDVITGKRHSHPLWPVLVSMVLPLMAGSMYLLTGNPEALVASLDTAVPITSVVKNDSDISSDELLELAQRHMESRRYSEAARILETLRRDTGDHPVILVRNANALAMANDGNMEGRPLNLVEAALEVDPDQPQGLWLAGMAGFQRGDNRLALEYWNRLEPLIQQEDTDAVAGIKKLIAQAEERLSAQEVSDPKELVGSANEASLQVTVKMDTRILDQVDPKDRLFVFVQSLQGSPVPLAVVSRRVEDLPLTVTLNDSMAMLPEMRLSNFENVRIGARVSRTGDAAPKSGDFQGEIGPIELATTGIVEVVISNIIP